MVTSTTANGSKFYGSTQKRAMLTHEFSNMAAHMMLLQSCVRNLTVFSLAMSSRPHDLWILFHSGQGETWKAMNKN